MQTQRTTLGWTALLDLPLQPLDGRMADTSGLLSDGEGSSDGARYEYEQSDREFRRRHGQSCCGGCVRTILPSRA